MGSMLLPISALGFPQFLSLARVEQQDQQEYQQHGYAHKGYRVEGFNAHGIRHNLAVTLRIRRSVSPDQEPVGIDSVGRAGHKGTVILSRLHLETGQIGRFHHTNLIHPVRKGLIQDVQGKGIPLRHFIQIGKQFC